MVNKAIEEEVDNRLQCVRKEILHTRILHQKNEMNMVIHIMIMRMHQVQLH